MGAMKEKWATKNDLKLIKGAYVKLRSGDIAKVMEVGLLLLNEDKQYEDYVLIEYLTNVNNNLRVEDIHRYEDFWTYIVPLDDLQAIVDKETCEALYMEL